VVKAKVVVGMRLGGLASSETVLLAVVYNGPCNLGASVAVETSWFKTARTSIRHHTTITIAISHLMPPASKRWFRNTLAWFFFSLTALSLRNSRVDLSSGTPGLNT
jgi:hypothetical protein